MPGQEEDGPKVAKIFVCRNPDFKTPGPRSKASKLPPMSPGMANAINNAKKFQQGAISATPLRGPYRFLTVINPITPVVENEESLEEEIEDSIMNSPVHPQVNQLKKVTPSKRIPFSPIPHIIANSPTRQRLSPHTSLGLQNLSNSQIVRDKKTPKTTPTREVSENPSAEITTTPSARTRSRSSLSLGGDGEAEKTASPMPCPEKENTPKSSQNILEDEEIVETGTPIPSPGVDSSAATLPTETPKTTNASFLSGANVTCEKRSRARKKLSVATPLLDKSSTPPRNQPQSTVKETPRFSFDSPFFKMPLPPKAKVMKKPFVLRKTVPSSQSKINKSHQSEVAKVPAFYLNPTPRGTKRVIVNEDDSNDEEINFESTKKKAKVRRRAMDHSFDLSMMEIEPEPIPGPSGTKSKHIKNLVNTDSDSSDDFLDNNSVNERRNATITTANKKRPLTKKELAAQAKMAKDNIDNQHQEVEKNTSKSRKRPASKKQQPDQNSNTKKANVKITIKEPPKPSAPQHVSVYDSEDTLDLLYEKARYVCNWIPKMKGKRMIVEGDLLDFQ